MTRIIAKQKLRTRFEIYLCNFFVWNHVNIFMRGCGD